MNSKYVWISWVNKRGFGGFTLNYPWWISGVYCENDIKEDVICAAIPVESEEIAKQIIENSFDKKNDNMEFRFNILKDGTPFSERFEKSEWMEWPLENEKQGLKNE